MVSKEIENTTIRISKLSRPTSNFNDGIMKQLSLTLTTLNRNKVTPNAKLLY